MKGKVIRVLVFIALVAVVVSLKFSRKEGADKDVLADMKSIVSKHPMYETNAEYLDRLLEAAHKGAFETAFTLGGRHTSSKFDEAVYVKVLFDQMLVDARRKKKDDVVEGLEGLRNLLSIGLADE